MRICFGSLLFLLIADVSSRERAIVQKYRIKPKICFGRHGEEGVCMFNYECNKVKGVVLATCVQGFLFGACCQLAHPDAELTSVAPLTKNTQAIVAPNLVTETNNVKSSIQPYRKPITSVNSVTKPIKTKPTERTTQLVSTKPATSHTSSDSTKLNTWVPTDKQKLSTWSFIEWITEASTASRWPTNATLPLTTSTAFSSTTPKVTFTEEFTQYINNVQTFFETSVLPTYKSTETSTEATTRKTAVTKPPPKKPGLVTWSSILWPTITKPIFTKDIQEVTTPLNSPVENLINIETTTAESTTRPEELSTDVPLLRPEFIATLPQFTGTPSSSTESTTTEATVPSTTSTLPTTTTSTELPKTTTTESTTTTSTATTTTTTTTTSTTTTTTAPNWNYKEDCGIRPIVKTARIVGGARANFGDWPWQVLVRESTWLGLFTKNKCGGVLINKKYVLTAAHCQPGFLASLIAVFGEFDLSGDFEPMRTVQKNVRRVVIHKDYVAATFENDIALLELDEEVDYRPHVLPICMPKDGSEFLGRKAIVSGWGRLRYGGGVPTVLQQVQVPVISNADCQKMFLEAGHVKAIRNSFICAGYQSGEKDSCEGDSGGPLMVKGKNDRWVLAGTVSHGIKCAYPNMPGVYMRMTYYKPWIKKIAGKYQEWDS